MKFLLLFLLTLPCMAAPRELTNVQTNEVKFLLVAAPVSVRGSYYKEWKWLYNYLDVSSYTYTTSTIPKLSNPRQLIRLVSLEGDVLDIITGYGLTPTNDYEFVSSQMTNRTQKATLSDIVSQLDREFSVPFSAIDGRTDRDTVDRKPVYVIPQTSFIDLHVEHVKRIQRRP